MNTKERKKIIEDAGFKIKNNKIIDIESKEQLKINEQDKYFALRYVGASSEIYIKNTNQIKIRRKNITFELKETETEQVVKLKDSTGTIKIITTLEGMMYKVGSIKIIEKTNEKMIEKEYIQRIEQTEINNKTLPLNTSTEKIIELLTKNIGNKKIIKLLLEENIKKIKKCLNENINKYIVGLEIEKQYEKIKILKKYQAQ